MGKGGSPIFLAGPTAVGKSDIALCLAERLGGEIISVDSMQVYRGLDIGTGKPSSAERVRVPHHLIDVVEITEPFDAAKYVELARRGVLEIISRGRVPILCGGTGLYFKAYLEGLGQAPPANPKLRTELESLPLDELLRELAARDPATFERIDRQNPRRVVRAVEVIRLTGKPFPRRESRAESREPNSSLDPRRSTLDPAPRFICFSRAAADLHQRIDTRVSHMFAQGLVEETRRLLARGLADNKNAMQAIGYRQVVEHLRGERSLAETMELVKLRTRQFAKRQMTWFRRQTEATWMELSPEQDAQGAATEIANMISRQTRV